MNVVVADDLHWGFGSYETSCLVYHLCMLQKLHPAILELGLAYSNGTIASSSARSIAMMLAMHCVVRDFKASESQAFSRALTSYINTCVSFLWDECRAACVSQRNSIKWLKSTINNVCPLNTGPRVPSPAVLGSQLL